MTRPATKPANLAGRRADLAARLERTRARVTMLRGDEARQTALGNFAGAGRLARDLRRAQDDANWLAHALAAFDREAEAA